MHPTRKMANGLVNLFYPKLCLACGLHLPPGKARICIYCESKLPYTDFHLFKENSFTQRLGGRVPFYTASSLFFFRKGSLTQPLIHALKYKGKKEIGVELGKKHGKRLRHSTHYQDLDWIIPVPLHPKKKKLRGYNQSAMYAKGLADALQVPYQEDILVRHVFTQTQTKKSRLDRFANVEAVFKVNKPDDIKQKSILLVDDVLTTGATLESCAHTLLNVSDQIRIYFATIAFAEN